MEELIGVSEVKSLTGLSKSEIFAGVKDGSFPKPEEVTEHLRDMEWPKSIVTSWVKANKKK